MVNYGNSFLLIFSYLNSFFTFLLFYLFYHAQSFSYFTLPNSICLQVISISSK